MKRTETTIAAASINEWTVVLIKVKRTYFVRIKKRNEPVVRELKVGQDPRFAAYEFGDEVKKLINPKAGLNIETKSLSYKTHKDPSPTRKKSKRTKTRKKAKSKH